MQNPEGKGLYHQKYIFFPPFNSDRRLYGQSTPNQAMKRTITRAVIRRSNANVLVPVKVVIAVILRGYYDGVQTKGGREKAEKRQEKKRVVKRASSKGQ